MIFIEIRKILERPVSVKPNQNISQISNSMAKKGLSEVFVIEKDFIGIVSALDLIKRRVSDPDNVKASYYAKQVRPLPSDSSPEDIINAILITDYRSLPILHNNEILCLRKHKMISFLDKNLFYFIFLPKDDHPGR